MKKNRTFPLSKKSENKVKARLDVGLKVVESDESDLDEHERLSPDDEVREKWKIKSSNPDISQIMEPNSGVLEGVEEGWNEEKKATPIGWLVLLGGVICLVGIWAVYDVFQSRSGQDALVEEKALIAAAQAKETRDVRVALDDMKQCVKGYMEAGSVSAMLPFVRHAERVEPLMRDYYKVHKRWRRKFERFEHLRAVSIGSKSFVYVQAVAEVGSSQNLLLEQMEDGYFRVDWESDVIYQPMPWSEYVSKRPLAPMDMRVKVEMDEFYGFAFRDAVHFQCYKLTTTGSEDYLFGYVEKGSEVARQMDALMQRLAAKGETEKNVKKDVLELDEVILSQEVLREDDRAGQPEPMILRIRFLRDDPSKRCVVIESLLADRWIYEESPDSNPNP